jgi:hypothetical protein
MPVFILIATEEDKYIKTRTWKYKKLAQYLQLISQPSNGGWASGHALAQHGVMT